MLVRLNDHAGASYRVSAKNEAQVKTLTIS